MRRRTILFAGVAAAGAALLLRKAGMHEDLDWESVEKPGKLIDVDGYKVHYIDQGAGPAMVLIHGFGGSTYSYRCLIPIFARDHRVIAVDLKGYGYSERDAGTDLSHAGQVAMLKSLLGNLGVGRATFVGHSMGGGVVQRFAAAHPEMVDALVLAASVSGDARAGGRVVPPGFVVKQIAPLMERLVASRMIRRSFYDPSKLTDDMRNEYMRPLHIKGSIDGLIAIMRSATRPAPVDVARITQPVLILSGAHDRLVPLSVGQRIRERIPQARMVVVDKAGHLLLEEQPEECARAILDFMRESRVAQGGAAVTAG
jgi:pimeloyl-ACP methyl ester carboxylesterase